MNAIFYHMDLLSLQVLSQLAIKEIHLLCPLLAMLVGVVASPFTLDHDAPFPLYPQHIIHRGCHPALHLPSDQVLHKPILKSQAECPELSFP